MASPEIDRSKIQATLERGLSALVAIGSGVVLAIAARLDPSPLGHSTHMQLGLAGCTFMTLTGHPCPMCGATTTFALLADLRLVEGLLNQPFAALLFIMTVGAFAVGTVEAIHPIGRWRRILALAAPYELRLASGFLTFMGISWLYKLWLTP